MIARDGYNVLDFLSDVGGMQGMLASLALFFLAVWNHNYFDNHMVSRLYKISKVAEDEESSGKLKAW